MYYPVQSKLPAPGQGQLDTRPLTQTLLWQASMQLSQNCLVQPDMTILTLLAGVSAVAQGRYDVLLPYGVTRPTSLATLIVAESGEGKSVVYEKVMNSIQAVQREQRRRHDQSMAGRRTPRKETKGGKATEERKAFQEHCEACPEPPREFQLLYKDTTPEGLFLSLSRAIPTAALTTDEAEVFFKSSMSSARGHINTLWDGRDTVVMRASKDNMVLEDVRLMLLLMSQPGVLNAYVTQQGQQARDSGMLARFIVCAPPSIRGQRVRYQHSQQNWDIWSEADDRLHKLARDNLILTTAPRTERTILTFSELAAAHWMEVANEIESQMASSGRFQACPDHASKLAENIARVAALIHVFEGREGAITTDTVMAATALCSHYSEYFQQVFLPASQEVQDAQLLSAWFNELRQCGEFSVRYNFVRQCGPAPLRYKKRLKDAIEVLLARQQISVYTQGKTRYIHLKPMLMGMADALQAPFVTDI